RQGHPSGYRRANFRRERLARIYHRALEPNVPPSNLFGVRHGRTPRSTTKLTTSRSTAKPSSSRMSDSEQQERQGADLVDSVATDPRPPKSPESRWLGSPLLAFRRPLSRRAASTHKSLLAWKPYIPRLEISHRLFAGC